MGRRLYSSEIQNFLFVMQADVSVKRVIKSDSSELSFESIDALILIAVLERISSNASPENRV